MVDAAASVLRLQGDALSVLQATASQSCIPPPRDAMPHEQAGMRSTQVLMGGLPKICDVILRPHL